MRIDSHQHFWLFDPVKDAWITPEMGAIRRDFLPNDISGTLKANGFDGVVAVQADQSHRETEFLVELSQVYKVIKAVVGWVDLRSPNIATQLEHFSRHTIIKGFRHIIEGEEDPDFLIRDDFQRGIEALAKGGYTFDLLIRPRHFESTLSCVRTNPQQKFMLDHLAKPAIRNREFAEWATFIEQLGQYENVYAKVSGLVTEAHWRNWKLEDFKPYIQHALQVFGPKRVVFGSDWPVSLLAASYEDIVHIADSDLEALSVEEKADFFGQNAVEFYGLT